MTKRTKRTILFSIALLVIAGIVTGYMIWNKPHRDVKHANATPVTATELYRSFTADSVKAGEMYINKVLEVSGEVAGVSMNLQNQQLILLKTAIPDAAVNCTMEENAVSLKPGDQVMIKGICSGYIAGDADMDLPGDVFIIRAYHKNK